MRETLRRIQDSRLEGPPRAEVRARLAAGVGRLAARDAEGAQALLLEAHEGSRNSVRLHVACHVGFVALELVRQDLAAAARELPNAVMAGPASVVRRAAGLAPDAPTQAGIRETWQARGRRSG